MNNSRVGLGLVCAIAAQMIWGVFPLYVDLTRRVGVGSVEFVAHRAIWSFCLLLSALFAARYVQQAVLPRASDIRRAIGDRKTMQMFGLAALLIATNWISFVWAVNNGRALDASLGYYICPQVIVLLGVVFLRERLHPIQWLAVAFATFGVAFMTVQALVHSSGRIPWIALVIAVSFGLYGLVKKKARLPALSGLMLETSYLLLPAFGLLVWLAATPISSSQSASHPWWVYALLVGAGLGTVTPLALYATAVKHIRLSTVGLLQFIGPTLQFLVGVFALGETFNRSQLIGFVFVWIGVGLYLYGLRVDLRKNRN